MGPFLGLFRHTGSLLLPPPSFSGEKEENELRTQSMILLVDIYYDFTCQDLPPALEDAHEEFFDPTTGWFVKFLGWEGVGLGGEVGFVFVFVFCFVCCVLHLFL
jgi:exportin-2 (importin alpha re-exporter)